MKTKIQIPHSPTTIIWTIEHLQTTAKTVDILNISTIQINMSKQEDIFHKKELTVFNLDNPSLFIQESKAVVWYFDSLQIKTIYFYFMTSIHNFVYFCLSFFVIKL